MLITCLVFAFLVAGKFYISALVAGVVLLVEVYSLFHLMGKSERLFRQFVWSIRYSDFLSSGITSSNTPDALPQELTDALADALQHYKKDLQQKESQLQYFQALANHIDLSVLVYSSETGRIEWMNQAAKIQTGLNFAETGRRPGCLSSGTSYPPAYPASR